MDPTSFIKLVLECLFSEKDCHSLGISDWSIVIAFGLTIAIVVFNVLYKLTASLISQRKTYLLKKDLNPYYSDSEIETATKYYITTNGQNEAPNSKNEPREIFAFSIKENLIDKFIKRSFLNKSDDNRFYIVLADSGMGKTSFMINLYFHTLKKKAIRKKFDIRIFPIGYKNILKTIEVIDNKKNTILLLDALDEDQQAVEDFESRISQIIDTVKDFRKVVITCRTQFFLSEEAESIETGIMRFGVNKGQHVFVKTYVSPFDDEDVKLYLNKRYGRFNPLTIKKKRRAKRIVDQSPNLVVRPMLLNYIDDLIKSKDNYTHLYDIYARLILSWVEREAQRVTPSAYDQYKDELIRFSGEIAKHIYLNRHTNNGLSIKSSELLPFAEKHNISMKEWELTGRSLLTRDAFNRYKFAHKSILEYFLFDQCVQDAYFEMDFFGFDATENFLYEYIAHIFSSLNTLAGRQIRNVFDKDLANYKAKVVMPSNAAVRFLPDIILEKYLLLSAQSPEINRAINKYNIKEAVDLRLKILQKLIVDRDLNIRDLEDEYEVMYSWIDFLLISAERRYQPEQIDSSTFQPVGGRVIRYDIPSAKVPFIDLKLVSYLKVFLDGNNKNDKRFINVMRYWDSLMYFSCQLDNLSECYIAFPRNITSIEIIVKKIDTHIVDALLRLDKLNFVSLHVSVSDDLEILNKLYLSERLLYIFIHNYNVYNPRIFAYLKNHGLHLPGKVVMIDEGLQQDPSKYKVYA